METAARIFTILGAVGGVIGLVWIFTGVWEFLQGRKNRDKNRMDEGMEGIVNGSILGGVSIAIATAIVTAIRNLSF